MWVGKAIEQGRFTWTAAADERTELTLAPEALAMLVSDVDLKQGKMNPRFGR